MNKNLPNTNCYCMKLDLNNIPVICTLNIVFFHKSSVVDMQYHCSYSITKLLIKENNKFIMASSKTRTRNE